MNDNHRDPDHAELGEAQFTAYALGQLGEQERADVEARLARSDTPRSDTPRSDTARQFVDEMRALGEHVFTANRQQPFPQPSAELRAAVEDHLQKQENPTMKATSANVTEDKPRRSRRAWALIAAAVCLLIAASPLLLPSFRPARETAKMDLAADASGDDEAAERTAPVASQFEDRAYDMGDAASDDAAELSPQDSPTADSEPNDLVRRLSERGAPGGLHDVTTLAPAEEPSAMGSAATRLDPKSAKPDIPHPLQPGPGTSVGSGEVEYLRDYHEVPEPKPSSANPTQARPPVPADMPVVGPLR